MAGLGGRAAGRHAPLRRHSHQVHPQSPAPPAGLLEEQADGGRVGAVVEEKEAKVGARLQEEFVRLGAVEVLMEQVAVEGLEMQGGNGHRRRP